MANKKQMELIRNNIFMEIPNYDAVLFSPIIKNQRNCVQLFLGDVKEKLKEILADNLTVYLQAVQRVGFDVTEDEILDLILEEYNLKNIAISLYHEHLRIKTNAEEKEGASGLKYYKKNLVKLILTQTKVLENIFKTVLKTLVEIIEALTGIDRDFLAVAYGNIARREAYVA